MGADLNVEPPFAQRPETLAAAKSYLERSGNADLLEVLGLVAEPVRPPAFVVRNGRSFCRVCDKRVGTSGYCFSCNPRKRGDDQ